MIMQYCHGLFSCALNSSLPIFPIVALSPYYFCEKKGFWVYSAPTRHWIFCFPYGAINNFLHNHMLVGLIDFIL